MVKVPLTTVGLFLIRLVLAVGHAIACQGVVDTVSISTLKLIDVVTRSVECCETEKYTQEELPSLESYSVEDFQCSFKSF